MTDQQKRTAINAATINLAKSIRDNYISKIIDVIKTAGSSTANAELLDPQLTLSTQTVNMVYSSEWYYVGYVTVSYLGEGEITISPETTYALFEFNRSQNLLTIKQIESKIGSTNFTISLSSDGNYAATTATFQVNWLPDPMSHPISELVIDDDDDEDEDEDETTTAIREMCNTGLSEEGNVLAYWSTNAQDELNELIDTGSDMFYVVTVPTEWSNEPEFPVTIIYESQNVVFDEGRNYYVIFTTDTAVEEYILYEAVGQSNGSITFDLTEALDVPMTMIVLPAKE